MTHAPRLKVMKGMAPALDAEDADAMETLLLNNSRETLASAFHVPVSAINRAADGKRLTFATRTKILDGLDRVDARDRARAALAVLNQKEAAKRERAKHWASAEAAVRCPRCPHCQAIKSFLPVKPHVARLRKIRDLALYMWLTGTSMVAVKRARKDLGLAVGVIEAARMRVTKMERQLREWEQGVRES